MSTKSVQKAMDRSHYLWTFGVLIVSIIVSSCKGPEPKAALPDQGECTLASEQALASYKRLFPSCTGNKPTNAPNLYAHFLEQSLNDELCFEDVLSNKSGGFHCSPGPFLIEGGGVVDLVENEWKLSSTPDYFVWHLDNNAATDEHFYITNQQGFPIKSQAIRLQNDEDATMVLLPSALAPGVKYYIYLTVNSPDSRKIWIQPITTTVSTSKSQ